MPSKIYCGYPQAQFLEYQQEITDAMRKVCENGPYILGPEVDNFESEFSEYNGSRYCVGVGSGTDALVLSLRAMDIGIGDEVITVSHTAIATVAAIVTVGATPVLVDIEEDFYTIDPKKIEAAITEKTKAIIPVHLYGQPCDMESIVAIAKKNGLKIIEDCAQAHGASIKGRKVGTFGDMGCFSFYPTKNLGAIGDAGGIITSNLDINNRLRRLRQYGWDENRISQESGIVSRLDELQAAILRVKLKYLDKSNHKRRIISIHYKNLLNNKGIQLPRERENCEHVYHLFVVRSDMRDRLKEKLGLTGIEAGIHYAYPAHQHIGYRDKIRMMPAGLSITEKIVKEILTLPIYPELSYEYYGNIIRELL
jgi:dTDP-4-amino-4,6-dideoxygalactose transaminase